MAKLTEPMKQMILSAREPGMWLADAHYTDVASTLRALERRDLIRFDREEREYVLTDAGREIFKELT